MNKEKAIEFQKKILNEYPRLKKDDKFTFGCHPGVSCFNKCCNDVNIFLTPYDIIRLKNALGIKSGEFLEKYTILPIDENLKHPVVMLQMNEDTLNCHLVTDKGCSVYNDRPWACRMYPLGVASPKDMPGSDEDEEFFFLLKEDVCNGFVENDKEWTVSQWMEDQSVEEYDEVGKLFKDISLNEAFSKNKTMEPVKLEMFYMVCYDIDKFKSFVFESTFLQRFSVEPGRVELMRNKDVELLKFGFDWLRFALFGEKTIAIKDEHVFKK